MPTDCGPTDTLEVGINFFVENVEKATTKSRGEAAIFSLLLFLAASSCCYSLFFSSKSSHMSKVVRVRPATWFCQILVWGGFRPAFPLSSFLSYFLSVSFSLSHCLFWQALFELSPHGSGQKSMPICVFSCSTLYWWRLQERKGDRWEKLATLGRKS